VRKVFAFIALLGVVYALALQHGLLASPGSAFRGSATASSRDCNDGLLADAYRNHRRRVEVCGHGVISRVLPEDPQGSRHQRFIVRLPQNQTLLVAYNIELAPRIQGLRSGMPIEFAGEYEWNPQGGIVHWTHHNPGGRHLAGWIHYDGRTYQ
jgi:Protein of unknown function (DUF3465)